MNPMEHALESAVRSLREAYQAELDMERQNQRQNSIVMQDQIKSLEESIGSLSAENRRLSCKNDSLESRSDRMIGTVQERIKTLEEQNKKLSEGKGYRRYFTAHLHIQT